MAQTFMVGDHVQWNSEAGWVSGRLTKRAQATVDGCDLNAVTCSSPC